MAAVAADGCYESDLRKPQGVKTLARVQASAAGTVIGTVALAQPLEGKGSVIGGYPRGRGGIAASCRRCLGHNSRINHSPLDGGDPDGVPCAKAFRILRRGASERNLAWGNGGNALDTDRGNTDGYRHRRVDMRAPPDFNHVNSRPSPFAPGISGRERVNTVGPPDAAINANEEARLRRGQRFSSHGWRQAPEARDARTRGRVEPDYRAWTAASSKKGRKVGRRRTGEGDDFPVTNTGERGHLMAVHYLVHLCFGLFSVNTLLGLDGL